MVKSLYIGRFQPLHLGHMKAIEYAMSKVDELIIIIGSAQASHSLNNPFTAGERIMMLKEALKEYQVEPSKYYLIPIPDATMHSVWVSEIISYSPPFQDVYSNEALTSVLFREFGIKVKKIPFYQREVYSATEVRRRILAEQNWRELLPQSVTKIIDEIGGIERLKELTMTDGSIKKHSID
ncbi:MAG: nicotinamide-nucleotide adenylyltransferase [Candidatus Bathyarchaeota archaeon]